MNIKDLLFVMVMALITTWAFEYFFFGKKPFQYMQETAQSQQFHAPEHKREPKPLNREVDFIDTQRSHEAQIHRVQTEHAIYSFTTDGGTLDSVVFKEMRDGKEIDLTTIQPAAETEKQQRCFLLAFNEKTPFFYTMHEQRDEQDRVIVVYKADTRDAWVTKAFTIFKKTYQVDLAITVHPHRGSTIQPRLIFPSPLMPAIIEQDKLAAVMTNEQGKVVVEKALSVKMEETGWYQPTLFGSADKYFVHAMVHDEAHFAQRAYYKIDIERVLTFLEGPSISEVTTWNLSFYMGPKTEEAMRPVDPRLEKTLDYAGWLTPISQVLLKLMKFLHHYLHNYGLVIIAVTFLLKLILLPFTIKGDKKAKEHAEFQRKLAYLKKKYKNDQETFNKEQTALIQKYGLPGLSGCLPMFIQLPIFFALNPILNSSLHLYKAPFLWIPDLSARDPFFILPILIVLFMVIQALTLDSQGRMPALAVALVIAAVSINFSAGLSLYIFTSALLGVLQTVIQKKVA